MITRREQIMRLAEFDENKLQEIAWRQTLRVSSGELENARLLPLITAMAERIETLDAALGKYKHITAYCLERQREFHFAHEALSTKGLLEELLGGTDE